MSGEQAVRGILPLLGVDASLGGISPEDAQERMDAIVAADLGDDDSLAVYDALYAIAHPGVWL